MADAGDGAPDPATAPPDPAPAQPAPLDALAAEPALNDALSPPRDFLQLDTTTEQPRTEAVALTPVVAEQDETCVYVFGANVGAAPDAATAKLAKRVLQISVVLIILQAIIAVVYYVRDEPLALILITLCFSLALAAFARCGHGSLWSRRVVASLAGAAFERKILGQYRQLLVTQFENVGGL